MESPAGKQDTRVCGAATGPIPDSAVRPRARRMWNPGPQRDHQPEPHRGPNSQPSAVNPLTYQRGEATGKMLLTCNQCRLPPYVLTSKGRLSPTARKQFSSMPAISLMFAMDGLV